MSKLSKHLGKGAEIEIEGEKYTLKPLDTKAIPHLLKIGKSFAGADPKNPFGNMSEDGMLSIKWMVDETLIKSFPDEAPEVRGAFGLRHMQTLLEAIMQLNSYDPGTAESKKKAMIHDRLAKLQKK